MKSLLGTVEFEVSGRNVSRLCSRCHREGIALHSVYYVNNKKAPTARIVVDVKDAKDFLRLVGSCGLHVKTKKRSGVLFIFKKAMRRPVLLLGAVFGAIALFVMSQFVWVIEYDGIYRIDKAEMAVLAEKTGFYISMPRNKADINEKAHTLSGMGGDIAKATAHLYGVRLVITVTETEKASFSQDDEVQNIYAKKAGVCEQVLVYSGKALVKKGDIIQKGDLLITGDLSTEEKTIHTEAKGKVLAKVGYTFYGEAGEMLPAVVRSGKSKDVLQISLFGHNFMKSPYKNYETEITGEEYATDSLFPIKIKAVKVYELTDGYKKATETERKVYALQAAYEKMLAGIDKDAVIISKRTTYDTDEKGNVIAVISVVTLENVGL